MRNVATIGFALGIAWLATGCTLDMKVGDWLKPDPDGNGSGSSGSGSGGSGSGTAGKDGGPPATPECIDAEQGSETSCKDVGTWKQYAYDACQSSGLQLGNYTPLEECGEGLYRYVSYSCCKAEPPPPPPPSSCIDAKQGSDSSCKDVGTWKQHAYDACQSSGLQLGKYVPLEECGEGLYRYVSYSCCKVDPPPPPPPSSCIDAKQGDATSCKDVGTWKGHAYDACKSSGLQLSKYVPQEECGEGLYRYVSYSCCKVDPPPPPPPPPTSCIKQSYGDATSCKDVKLHATLACESSGLSMGDYFPREQCGEGLHRYVDYTCCTKVAPPPVPPPTPPKDCVVQELGSATTCMEGGTWKATAGEACESSGLSMWSYTPKEECGKDGFRYVSYTCCPR
jgi:hypothetical protein